MTAFMAECFWPGVTEQQLVDAGARARRAAGAIGPDGAFARYMSSILVPSDEIAFCLFEATSIDAASDLNQRAAIPFERILEIVHLGPEGRPASPPPSSPDPPTTSPKELR